MQASSQLTSLLKISSVAGMFVSIILGLISAVWIIFGVAQAEILVLLWGTLFLGLPMFGALYLLVKIHEYLQDILTGLETSSLVTPDTHPPPPQRDPDTHPPPPPQRDQD